MGKEPVTQRETPPLQRALLPEVDNGTPGRAHLQMEAPTIATLRIFRSPGALLHVGLKRADAAVFALCVTLATLLSWAAGAFQTEFGGYPDEAAHYVTALMLRDYIAGGFPTSPVRFAENFYLHYPKVAFGHWPPVFHFIEAVWMLVFGVSRTSVLVLISLLTGAVAFFIYLLIKRYFGLSFGLWAATVYLLLTPVRFNSTMVMTESTLSLFGLLSILTFVRFLENESWSSAIHFGLWTSLAILTKGDGLCFLLVIPLALLFSKQWERLASLRLWLAALIVVVLCAPYTLWSFRMVQQGWAGPFSLTYSARAAPEVTQLVFSTFGSMLALLALAGAAASIRGRAASPIFPCMAAYGIGIIAFQILTPTGVEARKVIMAFPAILFLAVAGASQIAELLRNRVRPIYSTAALIGFGTAVWAGSSITPVHRPEHGFGDVAKYILSNPSLHDAVILVSTAEPAYGEGMLIAEIASRERRPGHFVLRASKVISHSDWGGEQNYRLLINTPGQLLETLNSIPVNIVVIDYPAAGQLPPHHQLLLHEIQRDPHRWNVLYTRADTAESGGRMIGVFQINSVAPRHGPNVKVDMTETLGRMLTKSAN